MPFINKRAETKRSKDLKPNGKCTNGTNCGSRVLPVFFIYHLPELSRTMAYTTRNTVNRLARNKLNLNPVVKGGRNPYIELQEHKLDQIAARIIRISLDKPIA